MRIQTLILALLALLTAGCALTGGLLATSTPVPPSPLPPTPAPTTTPAPTASPSPDAALEEPESVSACPPDSPPIPGWPVYCNERFGFFIQYPPEAVITETDFNYARFELPIEPDTNLGEKYLELIVQESNRACSSPLAEGYPTEMVDMQNVVIEGKNFLKQSGSDAGVGNIWEWVAYSTGKGNLCVYFDFVLHSTNPYNYPTPPPEFDYDAETAVFEEIAGSLRWYTP